MSDVAKDDGNLEELPVETGDSHDGFLELCALAATRLLNAHERGRIEGHMHDCSICREAYAQYRAMFDAGIPSAILDRKEKPMRLPAAEWSVDEAEAALFVRLDREEQTGNDIVSGSVTVGPAGSKANSAKITGRLGAEPADALWSRMWWQYAAAVVLVLATGVSLYRTGIRKGEQMIASATKTAPVGASGREKPEAAKGDTSGPAASVLRTAEAPEITALHAQLQRKATDVALLENKLALLEEALRASRNSRDLLAQTSDQLNQKLAATDAELATVRQQLAAIGNQDSQDKISLSVLEQQIKDLTASIGEKGQEIAREQDLLDHDRDIRELMGSRKLYIAEVYDVAKTGRLERPFGRVFYTKGKSLIFYAYDLDQQPGLRETSSSFQAWGRKGSDHTGAVNLGIFYADSAANKRWVLKSEDPKVLADIDAVFVTVEPHGGSDHPSGKHILSAYLRVEPNHP